MRLVPLRKNGQNGKPQSSVVCSNIFFAWKGRNERLVSLKSIRGEIELNFHVKEYQDVTKCITEDISTAQRMKTLKSPQQSQQKRSKQFRALKSHLMHLKPHEIGGSKPKAQLLQKHCTKPPRAPY